MYLEEQESGVPHEKRYAKVPRFSQEKHEAAVRHYLKHGCNYSRTVKTLGYPNRETLRLWCKELVPDRCRKRSDVIRYVHGQKAETTAASPIRKTSEEDDEESIRVVSRKGKPLLPDKKVQKHYALCLKQKDKHASGSKEELISKIKSLRKHLPPGTCSSRINADKPNIKWLTDITKFQIPAGKVYLSPIIDCYDGMVASWTIKTSPDADLVNSMLDLAMKNLKAGERLVVHPDRGAHYRWPGWLSRMEEANLLRSMSKKGCTADNSACEVFFGRLKNKMFYNRKWFGVSIAEFMDILNRYLHWYNEQRIKMSLGAMSPLEHRRSLNLAA